MSGPWRVIDHFSEWYIMFGAEQQGLSAQEQYWSILGYTDSIKDATKWWNIHVDYKQLYSVVMGTWSCVGGLKGSHEFNGNAWPMGMLRILANRHEPTAMDFAHFVCMAAGGQRKRIRKPRAPHMYNKCIGEYYGMVETGGVWHLPPIPSETVMSGERSQCLTIVTEEVET